MLVTQRSVESLKKDFAWDVERRRGTDTVREVTRDTAFADLLADQPLLH